MEAPTNPNSTPYLCGFNPEIINSQWEVINLIRRDYDYAQGPLELLLSGSVGSSKSLLMAHIGVTHCLNDGKARLLIGRESMPSLRQTLLKTILDHISLDLREGKDYEFNKTSGQITFANGAMIIPLTWHDKQFSKFRSYEFSAGLIEELTENDSTDAKAMHDEMIGRIGRAKLKGKKPECFVIYATNPDSPSHWAYEYFIKGSLQFANRKTIYSLTTDNPFLPPWYVDHLRNTYDDKMAQRLLYGKWVHIDTDIIYYEYKAEKHFVLTDTKPEVHFPLRLTFDFNIGLGKPMSAALMQYLAHEKKIIVIDEFILPGSRTINILEDVAAKGYFDLPHNPKIIVHGDSTGRHKDTRSVRSDYDIIEHFLANYRRQDNQALHYEIQVPLANPPVRTRHNLVNGRLCNSAKHVSLFIDKRCKVVDEGFTKTKLVDSGSYTEDDNNSYQHVITAIGYAVCAIDKEISRTPSRTVSF